MRKIRQFLPAMFVLLSAGCASVATVNETTTPVTAEYTVPDNQTLSPAAAGFPGIKRAPVSTPDTWAQLRQGFSLPAHNQQSITDAIRKYSKSPRHVEGIFRRGEPYIAYILHQVRSRNYPTEIVLLPFVESGYDPLAYSHGRAAGLWQFIPGTGKMFGLKQDWWYDGRRDIVESTTAALDYLGKLQQEFDGDWLLALAAYNSGSGTVRSAIRRNRKAGRPVDFWHLKLPKETRAYVPRLLAISAIVKHPESHGVSLPPLSDKPGFAVVQTGGQLDIAIAAELADVNSETLARLNPGFNRWATHPDGPYQLLIPIAQKETFIKNLASLPADKRIKWVRHRIKKGQTLSHIAQRYNTTTAVLRNTNNLSGTTIRTGHHLLVPVAARDASQYAAFNGNKRVGKSGSKQIYRVRNGDNLWNIAKSHKVSVRQVARWNQLGSGKVIKPGQKLVIWKNSTTRKAGNRTRSISYTVRSGDSLYLISKKYNVSIIELRRWNKLKQNKYIQPGQRLKLFIDVTRVSHS